MKITIDLKPKTLKSLEMYATEHGQTQDRVVQDVLDEYFENDYEEYLDDLYEKAELLTRNHPNINASFLQRELKIGYARSMRILNKIKSAKA